MEHTYDVVDDTYDSYLISGGDGGGQQHEMMMGGDPMTTIGGVSDGGMNNNNNNSNYDDATIAALPRILLMGPRRGGKTSIQVCYCSSSLFTDLFAVF